MHGQQNHPGGHRVVINQIQEPKTSEIPPLSTYSTVNNQLTQNVNNQLTQSVNNQLTQNVNNQLTATTDDTGQQIIQQFQIQLPDQTQLVDQQTQQIQIIQSDPNNPEQPQVITLYTWGGN